jgi:adenine-specific DNA-methyltransferase
VPNSYSAKLIELLSGKSDYLLEDKKLNVTKISELARDCDADLLILLRSNEEIKKLFFVQLKDTEIFKLDNFLTFINNHEYLPDSFTAYRKKIGLATDKNNYLINNNDVVLNWAYKDCILEGGQTKEDQKRKEVFFNEILAPDQINRLLDDKVFTNWKKYDKNGEHGIQELKENDNLIIKGNNLVVLHSLKKRYAERVKLIYIDPPYNTGTDSFGYNDRFNRSTWLTFMKNRLKVANELLSDDGAIYVQLDYNQVHYAKVLMDEIFKEENFQREIIWRIGWVSGYKTLDKNYIRNHDTILFYSKNNKQLFFEKYYIENCDFKKPIKEVKKFINNYEKLGVARKNIEKIVEEINDMPERYPIEDIWNGNEYDDLNSIAIVSFAGETVSKLLNPNDEVKGQKSEKLLERIIQAHTKKGDLILDFFGGSGTTAAVAHKMGRQYIICEQIDKQLDIAIRRLNKVIDGEQSGVSKRQVWKGGGEFVYCELANDAENFREEVRNAKLSQLTALLEKAKKSSFLSYRVDREKFNGFEELSEDDKRSLLLELVDANTLYINYSDIENKDYNISNADKKLNHQFYGK